MSYTYSKATLLSLLVLSFYSVNSMQQKHKYVEVKDLPTSKTCAIKSKISTCGILVAPMVAPIIAKKVVGERMHNKSQEFKRNNPITAMTIGIVISALFNALFESITS